ncbi:MAG TPA: hypothetical protein VKQ52_01175 [Puia sp.]|nr:hypothetical protein [Puia sp.]
MKKQVVSMVKGFLFFTMPALCFAKYFFIEYGNVRLGQGYNFPSSFLLAIGGWFLTGLRKGEGTGSRYPLVFATASGFQDSPTLVFR